MNNTLPKKQYRRLAKTLNRMADEDLKVTLRKNKTQHWNEDVYRRNATQLRKIISSHGWPVVSKVGTKASRSAWLIVQHADHDVRFQKRCLKLMKDIDSRTPGDVAKESIAFLTDRILVNEGKRQLFGTQFHFDKKGEFQPFPIQDRKNLNARRKKFNLRRFIKYSKP